MTRLDKLTSMIEKMRDNALGPQRYREFQGEQIGHLLQRILTECQERTNTSATQATPQDGKRTKVQAKLSSKVETCEMCGSAMRYTWGKTTGEWRDKTFACQCGHKKKRRDWLGGK